MSARVLAFPAISELALERKGSQLHWAGRRTWNMVSVHGPLKGKNGRQFFRVITAENETLIVYREAGEKGMRQLYLFCLGEEENRPNN